MQITYESELRPGVLVQRAPPNLLKDLLISGILIFAFVAMRVWRLTAFSLDGDEIFSLFGSWAVVRSSWWRYPGCRSSAAVLCTFESVATDWGRVPALDPAVTRGNIGRIHSPILPFMPRPQTLRFCTECRARICRVLSICVLLFAASEDVQPFDADRISVCLGF